MEWKISDEKLRNAANKSTFVSSKRSKTSIPGVEYYLVIHPNGHNEEHRGSAWLFLHVEENGKEVTADWTITTAEYKRSFEKTFRSFDKLHKHKVCYRDGLFDPQKKFFADGMMMIKLEGTLETVNLKRKATTEVSTLGELLSERTDMDFVIAVGNQEVKVSPSFFLLSYTLHA